MLNIKSVILFLLLSLQKHDIGADNSFTPNEGWEFGFEMPYNAVNWVVGGWVTILG